MTNASPTGDLCKICGGASISLGKKRGHTRPREYQVSRCDRCGFVWIVDPDTDYENIYDETYYRGRGADALVDYVGELEAPDCSIRQFKWQGILEVVSGLVNVGPKTTWLDYGCGNGGLVRFVAQNTGCSTAGYETGWIAALAKGRGIPILDDREIQGRQFDVITAIEVLEHLEDPVRALTHIRSLMNPGGVFFMTTGNVDPFSDRVLDWQYLVPEIHISLFTPRALEWALSRAGFDPQKVQFNRGFAKIYAFKVLKNLKLKKLSPWQTWIPWAIAARVLERKFGLQEHPIGWAK